MPWKSTGISSDINSRITALENTNEKLELYEIGTGNSGTLSLYTGTTILFDQYEGDQDAILSKIDAQSQPNYEPVKDASGNFVVVSTLDGLGNYTLSGLPVGSYAFIYQVTVPLKDLPTVDTNFILNRTQETDTSDIINLSTSYDEKTVTDVFDRVKYENNLVLYSSTLSGGEVSINADNTKFDVASGKALIANNYTDEENPTQTWLEWTGFTAVTVTNLAVADVTFLGIQDVGGGVAGVYQSPFPITTEDQRDVTPLGFIIHQSRTQIDALSNANIWIRDHGFIIHDYLNALGIINKSGNVYSAEGTTNKIKKSAGVTFSAGRNYGINKKDPNNVQDPLINPVSFIYGYQDGVGGSTFENATQEINPNQYDNDSGVLQSVPTGNYSIQRIFFVSGTNTTSIQYGQNTYVTIEQARAEFLTEQFVLLSELEFSSFRAWLIVKEGITDLATAISSGEAEFISAGKLGDIGLTGGSGSTGGDLQSAYNNLNKQYHIDTTATGGAFSVQDETGGNTYEGYNLSGDNTFSVSGAGALKSNTGEFTTGLKDSDVTTAVKIGDSNNTSLDSNNKTLLGSINETYCGLVDIDTTHYESGGVISINADPTKVDITSSTGVYVDVETFPCTRSVVTYAGGTGIALTYLNTNPFTVFTVDKNGLLKQYDRNPTNVESRDEFTIGYAVHVAGVVTLTGNATIIPPKAIAGSLFDLARAIGDINLTGNELSGVASTLQIQKSYGERFVISSSAFTNPKDPNKAEQAAQNPVTFIEHYRDGLGDWTISARTTIRPNLYDDGTGIPQSVSTNSWTLMYTAMDDTGQVHVQLGQKVYNTKVDALNGLNIDTIIVDPDISELGALQVIVSRGGATDTTNTNDVEFANVFGQSGVSGAITTMQQSYTNSTQPQITTNTTQGAIQYKSGTGVDTDSVLEILNNSGEIRTKVLGDGNIYTPEIDFQGIDGASGRGSNIVTNGTFDTDLSGWINNGSWSYNAGTALHTAGATSTLEQALTLTTNDYYEVVFKIVGLTTGSLTVSLADSVSPSVDFTPLNDGKYSIVLNPTTTGNLIFTPSIDFDGAIDDVTVVNVSASQSFIRFRDTLGNLGGEIRGGGAGLNNIFLGLNTGRFNTNTFSVAIGNESCANMTTGDSIVAIGYGTLQNNVLGRNNIAIGKDNQLNRIQGNRNIGIGRSVMEVNIDGGSNTVVGQSGYRSNIHGSNNVGIGDNVGRFATGSNCVMLGSGAGYNETNDNRLHINNDNGGVANPLVYGEFDNRYVKIDGDLDLSDTKEYQINGIGVLTPNSLGNGILASNLQSLGTLTGLTTTGQVNINTGSNLVMTGDTASILINSADFPLITIGSAGSGAYLDRGYISVSNATNNTQIMTSTDSSSKITQYRPAGGYGIKIESLNAGGNTHITTLLGGTPQVGEGELWLGANGQTTLKLDVNNNASFANNVNVASFATLGDNSTPDYALKVFRSASASSHIRFDTLGNHNPYVEWGVSGVTKFTEYVEKDTDAYTLLPSGSTNNWTMNQDGYIKSTVSGLTEGHNIAGNYAPIFTALRATNTNASGRVQLFVESPNTSSVTGGASIRFNAGASNNYVMAGLRASTTNNGTWCLVDSNDLVDPQVMFAAFKGTKNIVIGQTTPVDDGVSKLQVTGTTALNGAVNVAGYGTFTRNATYSDSGSAGFSIRNATDTSSRLDLGYDDTADLAFIQSIDVGIGYKPIVFNAMGGNILIGTPTDNGSDKLQVNGTISHSGRYGALYVAGNSTAQSIPTGASYTKITALNTAGENSNVTVDTVNNKITATKAGKYKVNGSFSFSSGTSNVTFWGACFVNNSEDNSVEWKRKVSNNDVGSASFTGFVTVGASQDIDFRVRHDNGANVDYTLEYGNLNIEYVGE